MNLRTDRLALTLLYGFASLGMMSLGCGGSGSSTTATTTATGTPLNSIYQNVKWGSTVTATFPSSCTMTLTTTGQLNYTPPAYYLGPTAPGYTTVVASTPSGLQLAVIPFQPSLLSGVKVTLNTCPAKASATTATSKGAIGYLIAGSTLFNAYEATTTVALADNVSYTFSTGGVSYTAEFIDSCDSHPTPITAGYMFHAHGVPSCVTSEVDTASGASHIIGVALDGFPIYGGRDVNGNQITVSQLDACNGITSATPEFPSGIYHYVLPLGVTTSQSSMNCYAGSVSAGLVVMNMKMGCPMPAGTMVADAKPVRLGRLR